MNKKLIVGNLKMQLDYTTSCTLAKKYVSKLSKTQHEVVMCPSSFALAEAVKLSKKSKISVGAQNVFWENTGAFTGEVGISALVNLGIKYVIVGHSERRQFLQESSKVVNSKVKAILVSKKIKPIVCVGENLATRKAGKHLKFIETQLSESLAGIKSDNLVVAYEPIWAIGTGLAATADKVAQMHNEIRRILVKLMGETGKKINILYGGSVSSSNAKELLGIEEVGGLLVGGASLKIAEMIKMANIK